MMASSAFFHFVLMGGPPTTLIRTFLKVFGTPAGKFVIGLAIRPDRQAAVYKQVRSSHKRGTTCGEIKRRLGDIRRCTPAPHRMQGRCVRRHLRWVWDVF